MELLSHQHRTPKRPGNWMKRTHASAVTQETSLSSQSSQTIESFGTPRNISHTITWTDKSQVVLLFSNPLVGVSLVSPATTTSENNKDTVY